jgi:mannose-6-phosphate isomerase-like protein (cupin superfamily)
VIILKPMIIRFVEAKYIADGAAPLLEEPHFIRSKVWGTERTIHNAAGYCVKQMELKPDHVCSVHMHMNKDEVFTVTFGDVFVWIGMEADRIFDVKNMHHLGSGDSVRIPPTVWHSFGCVKSAGFIESSTTDHPDDSYRATKSCRLESTSPTLFQMRDWRQEYRRADQEGVG